MRHVSSPPAGFASRLRRRGGFGDGPHGRPRNHARDKCVNPRHILRNPPTPGGSLDYLQLAAPPPLDAIVHCFWFLRGTSLDARPHPVVADGRFDIVLHAGEPFSRLDQAGVARRQDEALLAGQLTGPIHLLPAAPADVVGIRLRTAAAAALFDFPLGELTDRVETLGILHPRLRASLLRAASSAGEPRARRDALAAALTRFIREPPDPLTVAAVAALDRPHPPRLETVALEFGTSVRSIERRVGHATGLAPRQLARTLRFRRVFGRLERAPAGTLTAAALAAGYYDQAHCVREFRRFAGDSPTGFFGRAPELASALLEALPPTGSEQRNGPGTGTPGGGEQDPTR